ncbi:MAG: hypothetical protein Q8K46_00095 [Deltaproteobacteria bacterium]|nr:hypothetical protein [Deltaproteobacteria bacterium]
MTTYAPNQLHSVPLTELQPKLAARQAGTSTPRKRTKAEAMTSLQNAMNDAFNRAAQ